MNVRQDVEANNSQVCPNVKWSWSGKIMYDLSPGPSSPRNVQADALSINAVRLQWQPPEDPNGGIVKYSIEYHPVGQSSFHPWVDTDDGNKTTKDVTSLNGSTLYQFRVRAFSKVPGEWSKFVHVRTRGDGKWPVWERHTIKIKYEVKIKLFWIAY